MARFFSRIGMLLLLSSLLSFSLANWFDGRCPEGCLRMAWQDSLQKSGGKLSLRVGGLRLSVFGATALQKAPQVLVDGISLLHIQAGSPQWGIVIEA